MRGWDGSRIAQMPITCIQEVFSFDRRQHGGRRSLADIAWSGGRDFLEDEENRSGEFRFKM